MLQTAIIDMQRILHSRYVFYIIVTRPFRCQCISERYKSIENENSSHVEAYVGSVYTAPKTEEPLYTINCILKGLQYVK